MNDPILDLHATPDARLHPASISAVTLRDDFWQPRRDINVAQTLPSQYEHLEADGVFDRFRRCTGAPALHPLAPETPQDIFRDSDVYKWLEAASSVLVEPQPDVRALVDRVADLIVAAQCPDGYLDTFYILQPEKDRWEKLADNHQLYCMGHFIQAAIAHFRATGETKLLDVARRMADCIDHDFGLASDGKIEGTDGHEEIEMALVELYRATGEVRYLKLAQFLLEVRGRGSVGGDNYHQDHVPLRDLDRVTGHAVRALYYAAGATDLALETGESAIWQALDAQWQNFTARQMYVSGGAGSRWEGEAFGFDWELPNQRAYTETCAAIATVMWAFRIGQRRGEARYFDVLERALYNGVLSGLSLSGDQYFYQNPLADDGHHRREQWFRLRLLPAQHRAFAGAVAGLLLLDIGRGHLGAPFRAQRGHARTARRTRDNCPGNRLSARGRNHLSRERNARRAVEFARARAGVGAGRDRRNRRRDARSYGGAIPGNPPRLAGGRRRDIDFAHDRASGARASHTPWKTAGASRFCAGRCSTAPSPPTIPALTCAMSAWI